MKPIWSLEDWKAQGSPVVPTRTFTQDDKRIPSPGREAWQYEADKLLGWNAAPWPSDQERIMALRAAGLGHYVPTLLAPPLKQEKGTMTNMTITQTKRVRSRPPKPSNKPSGKPKPTRPGGY